MEIIDADVIGLEKSDLSTLKSEAFKQGQRGVAVAERLFVHRLEDGSGYIEFPDKQALDAALAQIEELEGATMKLTQLDEVLPITELMFDFDITTASDNTALLDANATTNLVFFKSQIRYQLQTFLAFDTSGAQAKTITLRIYNVVGDTLIYTREVPVSGGNRNNQTISLDPAFLDNPVTDLETYFTAQGSLTGITINEISTTITCGSGSGGGGLWTIEENKIHNVGDRSVDIAVATTPDSVEMTGTGTAYDGTYENNGANDSFGNPVLDNGTNSLIRDSTNIYWCLVSGITVVNPDFNVSQWWNQTGSIEGLYTAVVGVGGNGTGTITAGVEGGDALTTNSAINTPSLSIVGKLLTTWNAIGDYIVDSLVEPATGAAYAFMANGIPRWAIPVAGTGLGAQLYRSVFVGGYIVDSENPNDDTDLENLAFDETFIDCDTGTTGTEAKPDVGIAGAAQIKDGILVGELQASGDRTTMLPTGFFKNGVEIGLETSTLVAEVKNETEFATAVSEGSRNIHILGSSFSADFPSRSFMTLNGTYEAGAYGLNIYGDGVDLNGATFTGNAGTVNNYINFHNHVKVTSVTLVDYQTLRFRQVYAPVSATIVLGANGEMFYENYFQDSAVHSSIVRDYWDNTLAVNGVLTSATTSETAQQSYDDIFETGGNLQGIPNGGSFSIIKLVGLAASTNYAMVTNESQANATTVTTADLISISTAGLTGSQTIAVVPEKFRPSSTVRGVVFTNSASNVIRETGVAFIAAGGSVVYQAATPTVIGETLTLSFPAYPRKY